MGCTSLTEVDFGTRNTETRVPLAFDRQVFKYCTSLESIVFPADTTEIGQRMFEGCAALKSITFGDEAPSMLQEIALSAFWSTAITEFTFPTSMTEATETTPAEVRSISLGNNLFQGCSKLTTVTLSPSVTDIGQVFVGASLCSRLSSPRAT